MLSLPFRLLKRVIGYEWIGFFLVVTVVLAAAGFALASPRLSSRAKLWIICGFACIIAGSLLRYFIYETFYGGQKDASQYFTQGLEAARYYANLDFSIFDRVNRRMGNTWYGTNFMDWAAGLVLLFTGPTQRGAYLAFALLGLIGRLCIWRGPSNLKAPVHHDRLLLWLLMWPSLWWWTSVMGKDSVVLFGLGLAVLGYAGAEDRIRWGALVPGVALVFCIRPEVAAVVAVTLIFAYWLSFEGGWSAKRALQGTLLLAVGLGVAVVSMQTVGIQSAAGAQEYMSSNAESVSTGGSGVNPVGVSWYAAPLALVNVLFRPFPWEATNPFVLASGLEMYFLWFMIFYRWRSVAYALGDWRSNRLLRFALPFVLVYSTLLGMAISNLSVISRQRIFIFPFFFLLICWKRPSERDLAEQEPRRHAQVPA